MRSKMTKEAERMEKVRIYRKIAADCVHMCDSYLFENCLPGNSLLMRTFSICLDLLSTTGLS